MTEKTNPNPERDYQAIHLAARALAANAEFLTRVPRYAINSHVIDLHVELVEANMARLTDLWESKDV